ncbi:hypothetical protein [Dactylosporangium salmoneum]|uniref:Lipoprotein n=1 Tax=Dactylosporangium salmoneum TaxID=53361 RepID=A0ABP5UGI6_9ACTN
MRRALALGAAAALLLGSLAGCARPPGTDGDLADDWAMLPVAKVPEPVAGVCFDNRKLSRSVKGIGDVTISRRCRSRPGLVTLKGM